MVPHIFTHLDKMPMTASGKANRNALPEIDLENISTETEYAAPETTEEITTEVSTTVVPVELPERVPTAMYCEQFILAKCNDTHTTLVLYEKEGDIWVEKATANGRIGKNGM